MATSALIEALAGSSRSGWTALDREQTRLCVAEIIDGVADPLLIAAFLTRVTGTEEELAGAVSAVQSRMTPLVIDPACRPILDTCGTGGDGSNSVNISTAAAIVVASCGVRVAKHGNRSASGNSGSSEVLTELGINIEASAGVLNRCLVETGITFLLAPRFHPAMRHAAPIRRVLPFRTLFNLVGPLANPASPEFQLIGTSDPVTAATLAGAIRELDSGSETGRRAAFVVAGADGLDEVGLTGTNRVYRVNVGGPSLETWDRSDFGLPAASKKSLEVTGPADSASKIRAMIGGETGPICDVVLANAAAALLLVGKVNSLVDGVSLAAEAIDRGDSARLLARWVEISQQAD